MSYQSMQDAPQAIHTTGRFRHSPSARLMFPLPQTLKFTATISRLPQGLT